MNRRELFGLGAWCLGGPAMARAGAREAPAWRVRLEMQRHELAADVSVWAPAIRVQARRASAGPAAVVVDNACEQSLTLRCAGWDRDLVVAAGDRGECRMDVPAAAFRVAAGRQFVRGLLDGGDAGPAGVDATYALPIHHWLAPHEARVAGDRPRTTQRSARGC